MNQSDGNIKTEESAGKNNGHRSFSFSWTQEGRKLLELAEPVAQTVTNTIKKVFKRNPKPPKTIKKNTWRRRVKALDLKLDRRQQQWTVHRVADNTAHVCINCGKDFTGRFCPQCGQASHWSRFSWKQAILNLLDVWGLGNRPIFRTIRDLFWRPGYMARDYLNGHRQNYFPPFKLLAVTIVLLVSVSFLVKQLLLSIGGDAVNVEDLGFESILQPLIGFLERHSFSDQMMVFTNSILWLFKLLTKNILYEWLFLAIFFVLCIWIAHRHISRYNFVETYIFLVFVLCQQWLLLIVEKLGIGLFRLVEIPAFLSGAPPQTTFWGIVATVFGMIGMVVTIVFSIYCFYLFLLNFRQFYGQGWKSTIWHLFVTLLVMGWFIVLGTLVVLLFIGETGDDPKDWFVQINLILIPLTFMYASEFLHKNEGQVTRTVTLVCKGGMLSVFLGFIVSAMLVEHGYTFLSVLTLLQLFLVADVFLSLLPVILYKKYQRNWLSLLSLILLIAFIVLTIALLKHS